MRLAFLRPTVQLSRVEIMTMGLDMAESETHKLAMDSGRHCDWEKYHKLREVKNDFMEIIRGR